MRTKKIRGSSACFKPNMDASSHRNTSPATDRSAPVALFYHAVRRGECRVNFFCAVRASLWKTPAPSGRRSCGSVASDYSAGLRAPQTHLDASRGPSGLGRQPFRVLHELHVGSHLHTGRARSGDFLMEGQT